MAAAGDIDNDGDLDFVHNGYLGTQFVYLNDGQGSFTVGANGDLVPQDFGALALADLDGDGDLDLVITGRNSSLVAQTNWYSNDGAGLFTLMPSDLMDLYLSHVVAEDIDNDSDIDLIINGYDSSSELNTVVYLNNGLGDFTVLSNPNLPDVRNGGMAMADVDGDSDLDLVITGFTSTFRIAKLFHNDGSGNFTDSGTSFTGVYQGMPVFFDMDNDGDMDLLLNGDASGIGSISNLYIYDGGTFSLSGNDLLKTHDSNPIVFDAEADGDMDILMTGNFSGYGSSYGFVGLFLNDALGNFSEVLNSPFGRFGEGGLDYGDIDNDGDLDVIISGRNMVNFVYYTEVYRNDGFGNFTEDSSNSLIPRNNGQVHLADIDGDGDLDASVSGLDINLETLTDTYLNDGTGLFAYSSSLVGAYSGGSDWADVDNDGDLDFLTTGNQTESTGITQLAIQNTGGTFEIASTSFPNMFVSDCHFFDFDNDGDPDIVLSGQPLLSTCATYLYENDGTGLFTSIAGLPDTGYSLVNVTSGDLNSDGRLDLIFNGQACEGQYPYNCDVFLQNQSNEFELYSSLPGRITGEVEVGDLDNDGDLDMIVTGEGYSGNELDYSVVFYENDGEANFTAITLPELFLHADSKFELFDGDGDGDLDIAISSWALKDTPYTQSYYYKNTLNDCESTFATAEHTACDSYTWIDGNTYTESNNSAMYVLPNTAGCDSIITLNLTIKTPTSSIDTHNACESFTWIDGNTYSESNNSALYVLPNTAGCDSTVTLNLTINSPTSSIDSHSACESFTWIDGITYTESNNSAMYVLSNTAGCDSIVTLNLNITQIDANTSLLGETITANAAGATYQWVNCSNNTPIEGETNQSFTPLVSGSYAVIASQNDCEETSDCVNVIITSIDEISANDINLYPNPTNGIFQIQSRERIQRVRIFDALGKEIAINYQSGSNQIHCDQVASGNYIIELILANEIVRKSLRIQQ
jgi:hypothetical protein